MKKFGLILFILFAFKLSAQEIINSKKLVAEYGVKLELTNDQISKITYILEKHNVELYKKDIDNKTFNKLNKLRDLEIFKMLDSKQFDAYKKIKLKVEPTLTFRFN